MTPARLSCKDLLGRTSPGSPQDLLFRACTGSCKDILERKLAGSPQEPVYARIYNENAAGSRFRNPHPRHGRSRGRHGRMSQEPFYARILKENVAPQDRDNSFCVSLRNGHGHGHVRRVILCNNWHGKSRQTVGAP